jgi:ABC-type oligopeptide transport system substrate-binding subunit
VRLDVERARRLLTAAGFPEGKGFPNIGIVYNTLELHKKVAEVVADQLKKNLGITVTPYNQEWQSFLASVRGGAYEMARGTWIGDYLDPNTFLDVWMTSSGNNQTGFSSPLYDSLIRAAANSVDFAEQPEPLLGQLKDAAPIRRLLAERSRSSDAAERRKLLDAARMRLLSEAERLLVEEEFPVMPIYFYVEGGLRAPGLHGLYTELESPDGQHVPNLQSMHPLRDLWFDPKSH